MPTSRPPRIIFLTGAPDRASLDWTESALLSTDFSPPVPKPSNIRSAWRRVPLQPVHLPTGFSQGVPWNITSFSETQQQHLKAPGAYTPGPGPEPDHNQDDMDVDKTSFFTTSDLSISCVVPIPKPESHARRNIQSKNESFSNISDDVISHFYEHSLALHQDIASSQINILEETSVIHSTEDNDDDDRSKDVSNEEGETSLMTTTTTTATTEEESIISNDPTTPIPVRKLDIRGQITPIKDIPNAGYLHSITPQTMTVTVIVGIINIAAPRVVRTRRTGNEMSIVELLVGDDTRAGFGINLWLPHPLSTNRRTGDKIPDLAAVLADLRSQDIVLAENVALSTYQGRVYGQSLRKGLTRLRLLHRVRLISEEQRRMKRGRAVGGGGEHGMYSSSELNRAGNEDRHMVKIRDVRDWLLRFVGAARPHTTLYDGKEGDDEGGLLPADTP